MQILLTTTMALGALCILETTQPAKATTESVSPNIHLVRGGGGHRPAGHGEEGRNLESREDADSAAHDVSNDHPAAQDRSHTLENNLRNDAGYGFGAGWGTSAILEEGDVSVEDLPQGCAEVDAEGNCIRSQ